MNRFYLILFCAFLFSCSKNQITLPPRYDGSNLAGAKPFVDTTMKQMQGIYSLRSGNGGLGTSFVCKVSKNKVSFFSNESGLFFILSTGLRQSDSSIQFSGFWRYSEFPTQNTIQGSIASSDGASDLIHNRPFNNLIFKGTFIDKDGQAQTIELNFVRHFSDYVRSHEFTIFAHHGVMTTANPPYASNSLNVVLNAQDYGCDGLEFDVRLTRDNVPICIHNPSIDPSTTNKSPLYGSYDQYTFSFLDTYIELLDGQKIPSVAQALQYFIDSTTMKYFWMDIKGNPGIFKYIEPVVRNAYAHAAVKGRDVEIIAGIPSTEVIDEYKALPSYSDLPRLCELSLQDAIDLKCKYFGPRYTLGLLIDDVNKAHSMGMKVFSWTLNDKRIINSYLVNGKFDGFITDYPAYVVYDYYTLF
jgi:glycerophosphoryl diester phosphodiesterase